MTVAHARIKHRSDYRHCLIDCKTRDQFKLDRNHHVYAITKAITHRKTTRPTPSLLSWTALEALVVCPPKFAGVDVVDDPFPPVIVEVC